MLVGAAGALAPLAQASTIVYTDFSSVAGLTLNGSANQAGNVLNLTNNYSQGGSAFSTSAISLGSNVSFSSAFSFEILNSQGAGDADGPGADGLTFVVQTVASNLGGIGGGIGYFGIPNSVAIEFDTYNNGAGDGHNGNHVGIDLNGNLNTVAQTNVATRFNDGTVKYVWVDYNGATNALEVRLATTAIRPTSALLSHTVNLAGVLGSSNAFVGFTSGTGAGMGVHNIKSWEFRDSFAPVGVPESSATLMLLIPVLLGLFVLVRRRSS